MNSKKEESTFWWRGDRNDVHKTVIAAVRYLDVEQAYINERNYHHLRLYSSYLANQLTGGRIEVANRNSIKLNVIQSVIETAVSMIATNKPRIMNLTDQGSWGAQRRAKGLTRLTDAQFHYVDQYALAQQVFRDACIFGTGFEKITENTQTDREQAERVFPDDVLVDEREARMGKPRVIFQYAEISREVALELWGKKYASQIKTAGHEIRNNYLGNFGVNDVVSVVEAIHLPSAPWAKDGRHVICLDNCTPVDEPWTRDYFNIVPFRYATRPIGWWGWGVAEQLCGIQIEVNYLLQKIQRLMTLATSQMWIQKGSVINKNALNNEDWAVNEYTGQPPIHLAVQSVSAEYFQHLERLVQRAYEITGVSQLQSQGVKPAGLNSGVALDTYNDIQSARFLSIGQDWERFHVQISLQLRDIARDIFERTGSYAVFGRDRYNGIEKVDWQEIEMDEEECVTVPYPTSFFPKTPSGKLQFVQQMMDMQLLDSSVAASLFDYPDLESWTTVKNAPYEYLIKVVEDMVERGVPHSPEPYVNLQFATQYIPGCILKAEQQKDVPEENIELLRNYMSQIEQMLNPPPEMPPPAPPMPMDAAGAPMPPVAPPMPAVMPPPPAGAPMPQ